VANLVTERELAFAVVPFQLVGRNTSNHPHSPLVDFRKIVEEILDVLDLHISTN